MAERKTIFISYAQEDRALLDEFEVHLRPLEEQLGIDHWSAHHPTPGEPWNQELSHALSRAAFAVVLMSPQLLATNYVRDDLLPAMLERSDNDDLTVMVAFLRTVSLPGQLAGLHRLSLNHVDEPLAVLAKPQQDRVWATITDRVRTQIEPRHLPAPVLHRVDSLIDPRALNPVDSPLSREIPFINRLVISYASLVARGLDGANAVIGALSEASRAVLVTVITASETHRPLSAAIATDPAAARIVRTAREVVDTYLTSSSAAEGALRGLIHRAADGTQVLVVPLPGTTAAFLVGAWSDDPPDLTDATTSIFASAYISASEAPQVGAARLEATILDRLKRGFGFLPNELYERRRRLFSDRLADLTVHFQPIARLSPSQPYISKWEALCRDNDTGVLPGDVFVGAELWGHRFLGELDEHMLALATSKYREAQLRLGRADPGSWPSLSINVYPSSLSRPRYREAVRRVIDSMGLIPGPKLVLEISEKQDITGSPDLWDPNPLSTFRDTLRSYQAEFNLDFAIDDFGVGFSSVARLVELDPRYVKIDRRVIGWDRAEVELRYVTERMQNPLVVAEGVEAGGRLQPIDLFELGVKEIQGWLVAPAGADIGHVQAEAEASLDLIGKALRDRLDSR